MDFVVALDLNIDVPVDGVLGVDPVRVKRAVGRSAGSLNRSSSDGVTGGQLREGELRVAYDEGAFVLALGQFAYDFALKFLRGGRQLLIDARKLVLHIGPLAGVVFHVVEASVVSKSEPLTAHTGFLDEVIDVKAFRPVVGVSQKKRLQADAIHGQGAGIADTGDIEQGRFQINPSGNDFGLAAGLDLVGPANEERGAYAAFIHGAFFAFHVCVPAKAVGTVVGEIDHDGVIGDLQFVELLQNASHVPVDVFAHGEGGAGVLQILLLIFTSAEWEIVVLELLPPAIRHLHRRMRGAVGQVNEERLLLVLLHVVHGAGREIVDEETLSGDDLAVVFQHGRVVVAPVSGAEAVVFLNATGVGVIRRLHAVVPLAEGCGAVAGRFEILKHRRLIQIETFLATAGGLDAGARVVASGHELSACRRADRADVEAVEGHAFRRDAVNVGCAEVGVAVGTEVTPTLVVGQEDNDVGLFLIGGCDGTDEETGENEAPHQGADF